MVECPQILDFIEFILQFIVILLLYNWTDYLNLQIISTNNVIEFFKYMLNAFDSSKRSRKKNYFYLFIINLNSIIFNLALPKTRTLNHCINNLIQFELLECSLGNLLHILTDRYNTLTSLKTISKI